MREHANILPLRILTARRWGDIVAHVKTTPEAVTDKQHTASAAEPRTTLFEQRERSIILLLCALAALRIFVYSAAFPVFANIDEQLHLDTVVRYAHLRIPRAVAPFCPEAEVLTVGCASGEYSRLRPGASRPPPLWSLSQEEAEVRLRLLLPVYRSVFRSIYNTEATQPPVYYALAGLWYDVGRALGLHGGVLLHWLRLLNVPICALVVWLSYVFARKFFAGNSFVRLGAPFLVAFLPQDVFYCINNDVLSPLCAGAALYCLLLIYLEPQSSRTFHALTGLLVAAAFLVKFTNAPVVVLLGIVVTGRVFSAIRTRKLSDEAPKLAAATLAAGLPIAAWIVRSKLVFGDATGSAAKLAKLGWTLKPAAEMFHHPILSPHGFVGYWGDLISAYWRGEITWGGEALAHSGVDVMYAASTALFVGAAVVVLIARRRFPRDAERVPLALCLAAFAISVLMLIALSMAYDFGNCVNPSRAHPFFSQGRLISGTLIPLAVLYVAGLDTIVGSTRRAISAAVLVLIVLAATISELLLALPVFGSAYNFYHMIFRS